MAVFDMNAAPASKYADLLPRLLVGLVLAVVALAADYYGGNIFALLVAVVAMLGWSEWCGMHGGRRALRMVGMFVLAVCAFAVNADYALYAVAAVGIAAAATIFVGRFAAIGLAYLGLAAVALVWLRLQPQGFELVLWVVAVVAATDIGAYFAGRMIGGPKIAPSISPSKTWAGLGGGMVAAGLVGGLLSTEFELHFSPVMLAAGAAGLAIVAQSGDFFESHVKRRAGVKDSGNLLPGHGGILDRVDGLLPVSIVAALFVWAMR